MSPESFNKRQVMIRRMEGAAADNDSGFVQVRCHDLSLVRLLMGS